MNGKIQNGIRNVATRKTRRWGAIIAVMCGALTFGTGCDDEAALRAFRDAAASSLSTGMKSVFDGLVDGVFAAFVLGTDGTTTTTTQ